MAHRNSVYALVLWSVACGAPAAPLPESAQEALMETSVNGELQTSWTLIEVTPDGSVWVRRADLQNWGIQLADDSPLALLAPDAFVRLNDVPGVRGNLDRATSQLAVAVQPALLRRHDYKSANASPVPQRSPPGAFLNYDIGATQQDDTHLLRAGVEAGVAEGNWVLRSSSVVTSQAGMQSTVRLDSNLTADFPSTRSSLQVGDSFARLGTNSEPVRIGGFAWGTDFSVTPSFITVPLPTVNNLSATPGTVDLFVNGTKTQQLNVAGGPFSIAQVPVTTGAGELTVVTHDLLGRTQTTTQSYYISPQMLQAGLAAWDVEVGAKRLNYGMADGDYRGWIATVGERYGVTNRVTAQWRVEGDDTGGGISGQWLALTPNNALVTLGPYCTAVSGNAGCLLEAAYEHDYTTLGYGLDVSYGTPHYVPVAAAVRTLPQRWQLFSHAQAILPYQTGVTLGGTWREDASGAHSLAINVTASKNVGGFGHLDLDVSRVSGLAKSSFVTLNYTQSLGSRHSVSATAYASDAHVGTAVSFQQNVPAGDGYGYSLRAARDTVTSTQATGQWNTDMFTLGGIALHQGSQSSYDLDVSGAVLWFDRSVFLSRRLDESFAVIHAQGLPGVPVILNEQTVTHLDAGGRAVLPDLRPYQINKVALDATALPLDLDVPQTRFDVIPYRRGGALIDVAVHLAATVRLKLTNGEWVPAGARVREAHGSAPVGNSGTAYFEGTRGSNRLDVEWDSGRCRTQLMLPVPADANASDLLCETY